MAAKLLSETQKLALAPLTRNDGEPNKDFLQRIKNSARGYKARLTMALQSLEKFLAFFETNHLAFEPSSYKMAPPSSRRPWSHWHPASRS